MAVKIKKSENDIPTENFKAKAVDKVCYDENTRRLVR